MDRNELPNAQDVPGTPPSSGSALDSYRAAGDDDAALDAALAAAIAAVPLPAARARDDGALVADCALPNVTFAESPLDALLLSLFRRFVAEGTGYDNTREAPRGILGLLAQGREYMLRPGVDADAQHEMVRETLRKLVTPALPPFYRWFMGGVVPAPFAAAWRGAGLPGAARDDDAPATLADGEAQLGPTPWAPLFTSAVAPLAFGFLVGPARIGLRNDGAFGGLRVEKCKFLQESGCKGLCLHQCKLPAESFFAAELGVPLTVSPNFETQECQWSWGETPLPPDEDPALPRGCLVGCPSREQLREAGVAGGGCL